MFEAYRQKIIDNSVPEPNSGCWLWEKSIGNHGYGNFCMHGTVMTAPRAAAKAFICAEIPPGVQVLHKCDNKLCVNPDHLELGTHQENMRQASDRGLTRNQYGSVFSDPIKIARILADNRTQRQIAADYGVSQPVIQRIKSRWRAA